MCRQEGKTVTSDILILESARRDLAQSLRQWKMYAEEKEDRDIEYDNDMECDFYRRCSGTLKLIEKEIDKRCGIVRNE